MAEPFIGQIQPFAFGFPPKGWALCNGQLLSIVQNTALFSLLGTFYGGNGTTTFALPDLRSRVPMHKGTSGGIDYILGEQAGLETVQLGIVELPAHNHGFFGTSSSANDKRPKTGAAYAQTTKAGPVSPGESYYAAANAGTLTSINPSSVQIAGSGQAHSNIQPYLTINWCIALLGIYPSRN